MVDQDQDEVGRKRVDVIPGEKYRKTLPWSPICMSLKMNGWSCSVQLYDIDTGEKFSTLILPSEVGLHEERWGDDVKFYYYEERS